MHFVTTETSSTSLRRLRFYNNGVGEYVDGPNNPIPSYMANPSLLFLPDNTPTIVYTLTSNNTINVAVRSSANNWTSLGVGNPGAAYLVNAMMQQDDIVVGLAREGGVRRYLVTASPAAVTAKSQPQPLLSVSASAPLSLSRWAGVDSSAPPAVCVAKEDATGTIAAGFIGGTWNRINLGKGLGCKASVGPTGNLSAVLWTRHPTAYQLLYFDGSPVPQVITTSTKLDPSSGFDFLLDRFGIPHVCFVDGNVDSNSLMYATKLNGQWILSTLDTRYHNQVGGCRLAVSRSGLPRIMYRRYTSGSPFSELHYAR